MSEVAAFYDTTATPRAERRAYERHGLRQEDAALDFFRAHPNSAFSREHIERHFGWPTQTASRVLANLTKRGKLLKTGQIELSSYGRRCHTWRLADGPRQGRLL